MPAKDTYHEAVVGALNKEGWTITDDPLTISYGSRDSENVDCPGILSGGRKNPYRIRGEMSKIIQFIKIS